MILATYAEIIIDAHRPAADTGTVCCCPHNFLANQIQKSRRNNPNMAENLHTIFVTLNPNSPKIREEHRDKITANFQLARK